MARSLLFQQRLDLDNPLQIKLTDPKPSFHRWFMKFNVRTSFLTVALVAAAGLSAQADPVNVYLSAPFTQVATGNGTSATGGVANAVTEPFDNVAGTNTTAGGTGSFNGYDSPALSFDTSTNPRTAILPTTTFITAGTNLQIKANDQYGGGGQGNYLGIPNGSTTTLTLSQPVGYFGLQWNAVDPGNTLTLKDQNGLTIGTFNAQTFSTLLPNNNTSKITALNGQTYNTNSYFGQPTGTTTTTPRQNTNEQYAFLNFVAPGNTKIAQIILTQSTTAVFESDNYAIATTAPIVDATSPLVFVTTVPEPSAWALTFVAVGLTALVLRRRLA